MAHLNSALCLINPFSLGRKPKLRDARGLAQRHSVGKHRSQGLSDPSLPCPPIPYSPPAAWPQPWKGITVASEWAVERPWAGLFASMCCCSKGKTVQSATESLTPSRALPFLHSCLFWEYRETKENLKPHRSIPFTMSLYNEGYSIWQPFVSSRVRGFFSPAMISFHLIIKYNLS